MASKQEVLVARAKQAIDVLFHNCDVPKKDTAANLRDIMGHIEILLESLEE